MAKAKSSKALAEALAETAEGVALTIVMDTTPDTPAYYMNHAELSVGQHDISLSLARIPPKPGRQELAEAIKSGEILVDAELQIILPPTILPGLIAALQKVKDGYETLFGEIKRTP